MNHILFVEDDLSMQDLVKSALGEHFQITCLSDPAQLLEQITKLKPDVVLTDYRIPALHTESFLSHMRIHHPATPVVMITGFIDQDSLLAAVRQNVFDFVSKPFQIDELERTLKNACEVASERSSVLDTVLKSRSTLGPSVTLEMLRTIQAAGFQKLSSKAFESLERQVASQ
jgi:two-component system C4-dicarboxylate transport response regulator DctD